MDNIKNKLAETKDPLEAFRSVCRQRKISVTPQRTAIYSILTDSRDHPTTEDVYDRVRQVFPDISLDTVYRTLGLFSDMGIIDVVEGYGEAKRYDPDVEPHHHFRCKRCNAIVDFQESGYDKIVAPEQISRKYRITNIKVVVEGYCDRCAKE